MISLQFHRQRGVSRLLLALAILLLIPAFAIAQDYRGKVQGSVMDASKAAIAGAATDPASTVRKNSYTYDGLVGPGTSQTDMTLSKSFRLNERFKFEVCVESYNAFNQINWDDP